MRRRIVLSAIAGALTVALAAPAAAAPKCSELGIANHAEHVVGDYVTGTGGFGGGDMTWPPRGQVGSVVGANRGPENPGGSGKGHLEAGLPPGASFCD